MKLFTKLLVCTLLISSMLIIPTAATEVDVLSDQIVVSQTVEYIGNDCYFIETIYVPSVQPYGNAKTGTKTSVCVSSGTSIFAISVTGTFTYDGTTSDATSASCSVVTYVENATITSRRAYTSGASACAFGSVSYNGATLQKTVTLTCDKNGNLS